MKKLIIGVDIGGTNTDAVLVDEKNTILSAVKTPTTHRVVDGFSIALQSVIEKVAVRPESVTGVFVGTTHATNALLQKENLYRVGVIRLAGNSGKSIPTAYDWPAAVSEVILSGSTQVNGGWYCDGRPLEPVNKDEIEKAIDQLFASGMQSLAIVGVYAPMNNEQELEVTKIAREMLGENFPITLSSAIGGLNFLERENATVLNAALKKSIQSGFSQLLQAMTYNGFTCPLFLTQNNGTILPLDDALAYPVLTISAGPTNSFIGGSKLAGLEDAIVADIGGTSTDVGIVLNGFARRSAGNSMIAGITLSFQMPDVQSIALGGGSIVKTDDDLAIGPKSVAKNLMSQAQCFGGQKLTLTDIAVLHGAKIEGAQPSKIHCSKKDADRILAEVDSRLEMLRKKIGGARSHLPLVLVGGGAQLLRGTFIADKCIIPDDASVANAYGASLSEISGVVDTVVCLKNREEVLEGLRAQATDKAVKQGADLQAVRIIEQQIIPYHYLSEPLARVRIMVAGNRRAC